MVKSLKNDARYVGRELTARTSVPGNIHLFQFSLTSPELSGRLFLSQVWRVLNALILAVMIAPLNALFALLFIISGTMNSFLDIGGKGKKSSTSK